MKERKAILSVAGFDPSGGAGLLADIKTFERHRLTGLGIPSGITFQNEKKVYHTQWMEQDTIDEHLKILSETSSFSWAKIGIVKDLEMLENISKGIKLMFPEAQILWDPVLKSSSGFDFFPGNKSFDPSRLIGMIDFITPNLEEFSKIFGNDETAIEISKHFPILRKGGHSKENPGKDHLFYEGKIFPMNPRKGNYFPKHGSGCVYSSALASSLTKGYPPLRACLNSKRYIEHFLASSKALLGIHYQ